MKKKIIFLIVLLLLVRVNVYGLTYAGCDYSSISRLKSLISNINISYDYHINNNIAYFDVTLTNIPENVYFVDTKKKNTYYYSNTNNGEITLYNYNGSSGNFKFYSDIEACRGTSLGTKYYSFPTYNVYYTNELCKDIPEFNLCQKWANVTYSYNKFQRLVYEYKAKGYIEEEPEVEYNKSLLDRIVEFYVNYYYYFLGGIIVIGIVIIIIKRRKDSFKL